MDASTVAPSLAPSDPLPSVPLVGEVGDGAPVVLPVPSAMSAAAVSAAKPG
ncbi:hypothetical protein [Nannocystis pusilla]|uniref:hypothetical protein n=1 Tax=Nannocystis pusilla TaxID=889268 RepID=UPI003B79023F